MSAVELKNQYDQLYATMSGSKDVAKMKHFGAGFTAMFHKAADSYPDLATSTLEFLSGIEYYNFVTPNEATSIASRFVNDDTMITGSGEPSKGAHWSMDALKGFLSQNGIPLEDKPYYNWPALWLTVNMIYSDFANTLVELYGSKDNEHIAQASYKFAVNKLRDLDRPHFIREYFHL